MQAADTTRRSRGGQTPLTVGLNTYAQQTDQVTEAMQGLRAPDPGSRERWRTRPGWTSYCENLKAQFGSELAWCQAQFSHDYSAEPIRWRHLKTAYLVGPQPTDAM